MIIARKIQFLIGTIVFFSLTLTIGLLIKCLPAASDIEIPLLSSQNAQSNIDSMVIEHGSGQIALVQDTDGWFVKDNDDEIPARELRVKDFFSTLRTLNLQRVVATNKLVSKELMLETPNAWILRLHFKQKNAEEIWIFGSVANGEQFVRQNNSEIIRATSSALAFYLQQAKGYWVDRRLWPSELTMADIVSMQINKPGKEIIELQKHTEDGADIWSIKASTLQNLAPEQIAQWTHDMAVLEADNFYSDPNSPKFPLGDKKLTLSIQANNKKYAIDFYAGENATGPWYAVPKYPGRPISKLGKPLVFTLAEGKLQQGIFQ